MYRDKTIQIKKLKHLKERTDNELNIRLNEHWFVNKTDKVIPTNIQGILSLGPKHSLPNTTTTFPLFKFIAEGEECIRTVMDREEQEVSRVRLVSLIDNHLHTYKLNQRDKAILDTVGQTRKFLRENDDILILSADKGGKTVAMDKYEYKAKMGNILGDICTYGRMKRDPTSSLQAKNNRLVEKLFNRNIIDVTWKNKLLNKVTMAPRIYGLPKIHKDGTPLRPICSSINSPAFGLCKYLIDILKNLTRESKYNVKDAVDFKSKIRNLNIADDELLVSFDVISLFPSIPINLALKTIKDKWEILEKFTTIPQELFMEILTFCIKETRYFKYDDRLYEQKKGMPMGSPASPVIADVIMEVLLDTSLEKMKKRPKILTKYVDDLFGIVKREEIDNTLTILNSFHRQIQFTMEEETNNRLPYLDSVVIRQGHLLKLDWYQKPTASGRIINFNSKHPRRTIINTATNFIKRVLQISDDQFHDENKNKIRKVLDMNDFPRGTVEELMRRASHTRPRIDTDKPQTIYKPMTYLPGLSERLKHSNIYDKDKYELAFKSQNTVSQLFSRTKSRVDNKDKHNVVYRIKCNGDESNICHKVYVGTTQNKLKTRLSAHKSDIKLLDKPLEQKTALAAHCATTSHKPNFNDVEILAEEKNYGRRLLLEMIHINDVPKEKRLNFKRDTENLAQVYRYTMKKHRRQ